MSLEQSPSHASHDAIAPNRGAGSDLEFLCSLVCPCERPAIREGGAKRIFELREVVGPYLTRLFALAAEASHDRNSPRETTIAVREYLLRTALDFNDQKAPAPRGACPSLSHYLSRYDDDISETAFRVLGSLAERCNEVLIPLFLHYAGPSAGRNLSVQEDNIVEYFREQDGPGRVYDLVGRSLVKMGELQCTDADEIRHRWQLEMVQVIDDLLFYPNHALRLNSDFLFRLSAFVVSDDETRGHAYKEGIQVLAGIVDAVDSLRGAERVQGADVLNFATCVLMYEHGHASRLAANNNPSRLNQFSRVDNALDIVTLILDR